MKRKRDQHTRRSINIPSYRHVLFLPVAHFRALASVMDAARCQPALMMGPHSVAYIACPSSPKTCEVLVAKVAPDLIKYPPGRLFNLTADVALRVANL